MNYKIAVGADHRGYELKKKLTQLTKIGQNTINWTDVGTFTPERTDYPIYTQKVVDLIKSKEADLGILICGSGIGVVIAANRRPGIYAGVAWNPEVARLARSDDNVNILSIAADFTDFTESIDIIEAWLSAEFKHGRYQERLTMIDK